MSSVPMRRAVRTLVFLGASIALPAVGHAQQFSLFDRDVQVHGSIQQGYIFTDNNNFLTMDTSKGSGEMTDGALNVSMAPMRKLRVGAQFYARNVGELGNGHPEVDWVYGDYRFHQAFGIRAGKVKTPLGLYNDTQDMEFLHTWALLPQGVYPLDLRSVTIAHVGADAYGAIGMGKGGTLNYTVYGGTIPDDSRGGYRYGVEDLGLRFTESISKRGVGTDLRWTAPLEGLTAGYSLLNTTAEASLMTSVVTPFGTLNIPAQLDVDTWRYHAFYGDFQKDQLHLSAELRKDHTDLTFRPALGPPSEVRTPATSWFVAGSYRVTEHVELGSYRSQHVADTTLPSSDDANHIYTTAVTVRVDVTRYWHLKVEGHFVDGYGSLSASRGFYLRNNETGLSSDTRMLVLRTGFNF